LSACAELANGVSQLAQNAALGMVAVCGSNAAPLTDHSQQLAAAPRRPATALAGERTAFLAVTNAQIGRTYVPEAVAEFARIDPRRPEPARLVRPAFGLGTFDAAAQASDHRLGEIEAEQARGTYEAERIAAERALAEIGGRVEGDYVFFDDPSSSDHSAALSGEGSADVSGDNIDPLAKDYNLTPDILLSRGGITLSGGYSSVEGISVGGKIVRQNIGGTDREVSAGARYSKVRQLLEIGYADRNFLGGSLGVAPTLFAHRTSAKGFGNGLRSTPFAQSSYGFGIQFSRKFDSNLSLTANYRLSSDAFMMRGKNRACDASFFGSPLCNALGRTTNSLLSAALAFDRRERNGLNMRGYRLRFVQDLGLGGSAPYSKTRLGGEAHIGLGNNWTLMLDAEGGYLTAIGKRDIPLFDRFYAGDTSLRGFDLRGVGPKVRPSGAVHGQNVAIGGRAYYIARAELSGSVGGFFERYGVQPSLFVDTGSVFGANRHRLMPGEMLLGNSAKPRVSAGVGLAMKTPAGTLRVDFARALVKQPGDRTQGFSISFGAAV
jgi:hypothetical protein